MCHHLLPRLATISSSCPASPSPSLSTSWLSLSHRLRLQSHPFRIPFVIHSNVIKKKSAASTVFIQLSSLSFSFSLSLTQILYGSVVCTNSTVCIICFFPHKPAKCERLSVHLQQGANGSTCGFRGLLVYTSCSPVRASKQLPMFLRMRPV